MRDFGQPLPAPRPRPDAALALLAGAGAVVLAIGELAGVGRVSALGGAALICAYVALGARAVRLGARVLTRARPSI